MCFMHYLHAPPLVSAYATLLQQAKAALEEAEKRVKKGEAEFPLQSFAAVHKYMETELAKVCGDVDLSRHLLLPPASHFTT